MLGRLRMRRILLALIPGMAVAALAGQDLPQSAEVSYGYAGPLKASAWQVGTECYVPIAETRAWGWVVTLTRFDAKVDAEGRSVRVPYRIQAGKEVLPLSQVVKQLGASYGWRSGAGHFEVWSPLTKVKIGEGGVGIDAPFPVKPYITHLTNPPRAVLDLHGARLETFTEVDLPPNARIAQFKPDVVRIVIETEHRFQVSDELKAPLRGFDVKFGAAAHPDEATLAPPVQAEPRIVPPILIEPPVIVDSNAASLPPPRFVGPLEVLEEGPRTAILRIPLGSALAGPPKISRPEPKVLRLVLPGVQYRALEGENPYESAVEKVETELFPHAVVVNVHLARPMGLEMSYSASELRLSLIKPEVGDGKLAGKTVVVDAGHGGHDSGARSPDKKTQEKDLTLKVATKLAADLAANGATVIMTRKTDVFIPLQERSEIANRNGADFFLSVHINSNRSANTSSGTITFHHKKDPIGILLGECIQAELAKVNKLPNMGVWSDQRIYNSGFAVLRYAKMPAVLLELGFINHRTDRARMTSADFPADVARAVVRGLRVFLGDAKD